MKPTTRRTFMKGSIAAGAAMLLPHSRVLGANDDIRMGVIGVGNVGRDHVKRYRKMPGVRVVAICEVDKKRFAAEAKKISDDRINMFKRDIEFYEK